MKKDVKNKKQGLFKKVFPVVGLAAMVSLIGATPVLAADWQPGDTAIAAVSKVLETGQDVVVPGGMTFKFEISKVSLNDYTDATNLDLMPELSIRDITITESDKVTELNAAGIAEEDYTKDTYAQDGYDTTDSALVPESDPGNILSGFYPLDSDLTVGVYVYLVKETANTVTVVDDTREEVIYDAKNYHFKVYVNEDENGNKYIASTQAVILTEEGTEGAEKVDPTPGTSDITPGDKLFSGMSFKNGYSYDKGTPGEDPDPENPDPSDPDPENPDTYGLRIDKTVTRKEGDTNEFPFTFSIAKPTALGHDDAEYEYYVATGTTLGPAKTASYGSDVTEKLTHGQSIIVRNAYRGSMVAVNEELSKAALTTYIPSFSGSMNGKAITGSASMGHDLTIGANQIMGAASNIVNYTNRFQDMTPTGILMNNFPFVMMILVAVIGIGAFSVLISRRKRV